MQLLEISQVGCHCFMSIFGPSVRSISTSLESFGCTLRRCFDILEGYFRCNDLGFRRALGYWGRLIDFLFDCFGFFLFSQTDFDFIDFYGSGFFLFLDFDLLSLGFLFLFRFRFSYLTCLFNLCLYLSLWLSLHGFLKGLNKSFCFSFISSFFLSFLFFSIFLSYFLSFSLYSLLSSSLFLSF